MKNELIFLIGLMGSGKTTLGALLAQRLNYRFVDMDQHIERKTGKSIAQLFELGETYFRDIESEICAALAQERRLVAATGGGVPLRRRNVLCMKENGIVIYNKRAAHLIAKDIKTDHRPLLRGGVEQLYALERARHPLYMEAADMVISNEGSRQQALDRLIECVQKFPMGGE